MALEWFSRPNHVQVQTKSVGESGAGIQRAFVKIHAIKASIGAKLWLASSPIRTWIREAGIERNYRSE